MNLTRHRMGGTLDADRAQRVQFVLTILLLLLLAGGIYCGYLFYTTVRDLVAHSRFAFLPSSPSVNVARANTEYLPNLEKKERINILLLGIDRRAIEQGPCRTDTMIVVSVDPEAKSVSMLSIPRDLWVLIPDYNVHNRINAAHLLGDAEDYPGGGPALAKKTVQYLLGVPIHYYVRINFSGFEQIVDMLGGITINVEERIYDDKFPDENYGYMTVDIPAGIQKMDGKTALQYARVRHGSSDLTRARRQQQVIVAIKDKALSMDIPLSNLPKVLRTLGDSVDTDLTLSEMEALARLAREIRPESLRAGVIDETMTRATKTPEGWDVLIGDPEKISRLAKELFPEPARNGVSTEKPVDMLIEEAAKIEVQNGTMTKGLAEMTANYLSKQGYQVVGFSNADRFDYAQTVIIAYANKPHTLASLIELLGVAPQNVRHEQIDVGVDIRIILGADYRVR